MTAFDYAVIIIIALSALLGVWRGVIGEVLALAAWVLAFFTARYAAPHVAPALGFLAAEPGLRLAFAWIGIFIGVLIVVAIARQVIRLLLKAVGLSGLDRLLGSFFGIARGVLVVLFGVLLAGLTPLPKATWWQEAVLAPPFETVVLAGKPYMPPDLAKRIDYR